MKLIFFLLFTLIINRRFDLETTAIVIFFFKLELNKIEIMLFLKFSDISREQL